MVIKVPEGFKGTDPNSLRSLYEDRVYAMVRGHGENDAWIWRKRGFDYSAHIYVQDGRIKGTVTNQFPWSTVDLGPSEKVDITRDCLNILRNFTSHFVSPRYLL
jgi:hypothetical protein